MLRNFLLCWDVSFGCNLYSLLLQNCFPRSILVEHRHIPISLRMASVTSGVANDVDVEQSEVAAVKARKQSRTSQDWVKNKQKICRNRGEEYVNASHKHVLKKYRVNLVSCCQMPESVCQYSSLTTEKKDMLFMEFYDMGDYNRQNTYLFGLTEKFSKRKAYKKDRVNPDYSQRNWTYKYYVIINNRQVPVCQKALLSVFCVTVWRL